ncbi:hypothetical protein SANTM175S_10360 [Streptomyces antimycoticus]
MPDGPEEERLAAVRQLAGAEMTEPFDLSTGPLLRAKVLRLEEHDHVLLLTVHHVATDAWSQGILVGELSAAYEAFDAGREPVLPPLPVQYADYAEWERDWLSGSAPCAASWTTDPRRSGSTVWRRRWSCPPTRPQALGRPPRKATRCAGSCPPKSDPGRPPAGRR